MEQVYLDSFKLHDIDDDVLPYWIMPPIKGLESAALRVNTHNRAGQDGTITNSIYQGERRINWAGKVASQDNSDHVTDRRALLAALTAQRDSNGLLVHKTLRFTAMDGNEYQIQVDVVGTPTMDIDNLRHSTYYVDLLANQPALLGTTQHSAEITTLTRGGFVLPALVPIVFSSSVGGQATLNNAGNTTTFPIITLTGPLTNPRLINKTNSEYMAFTISLADGEYLTIDTYNHTIVQGGVTNRMSTLSSESTYLALASGNSIWELTTGVSGELGKATAVWFDAYDGI